MYQYYFEAVFVVTRTLDAYREAHSTPPVPELDADHPHHENYDDHFAVTSRRQCRIGAWRFALIPMPVSRRLTLWRGFA